MFERLLHRICVAALTSLLLPAVTACTHDGDSLGTAEQDGRIRFTVSSDKASADGGSATRGQLVTSPEEGIGLFGYNYKGSWNSNRSSTLFFNDQLIGFDTEWMTAGSYLLPNGDERDHRTLRFFAYYPYADDPTELGITFDKSVVDTDDEDDVQYIINGAPAFDYVVPTDIELQKDLMVGQTADLTLADDASDWDTYSIKLNHLLTAIRIKVGSEVIDGQITKVTLKNIKYKGRYEYDPDNLATVPDGDDVKWYTQESAMTNFTQDVGFAVESGKTDYVTDETQTFMMMPQVLNQGARLEIEFNDGQKHLLYAIIGGKKDNPAFDDTQDESPTNPKQIDREWKRAKVVTYTVNIKTLNKITVTTSITDWSDAENSVSGSVSDAATIVTTTDVDDWIEGHVVDAGDIIANQPGN